MKRVMKLFILLLVLIPTLVFAKEQVEITNVELIDSTENLDLKDPTFSGLETNFNIKFNEVNDFVKYKIIVNNTSNKDYELSLNNYSKSEYIEYKYDINNNVLNKNSSKEITLTITYKKEIDESKYQDGVFIEDNNMRIDLGGDDVINPKTGFSYIYLILVVAITLSITLLIYVFGSRKLSKYTISILVLFLIPISVLALEKLELKVNSHVEITDIKEMCFIDYRNRFTYYNFKNNMTWEEHINSDYFEIIEDSDDRQDMTINLEQGYVDFISANNLHCLVDDYDESCPDIISENVLITDTIKSKNLGCYSVNRK